MGQFFTALEFGMKMFPMIATLIFIPIIIYQLAVAKKVNLPKLIVGMVFVFYMICAYGFVIFPMPNAQEALNLSGYDCQLVPFMFISDILRESSFEISNISTYLPTLLCKAVQQVFFNVLMTVPFGMFLKYLFNLNLKRTLVIAFALSLFFELTQLTGLYFIFSGSYRLFDVDDLLLNTLGGLAGFGIMSLIAKKIPDLNSFGIELTKESQSQNVSAKLKNHVTY